MKQKKGTAETVPPENEPVSSFQSTNRKPRSTVGTRSQGIQNCKIEFFPDGVAMVAPYVGNSSGKGAPPRSEIKGWSKSSRRRMREFLLTHRLPENRVGFSCTFTIPGPPLPAEKMKQLKNTWQIYLRRAGGCAVWRAEVQKRGSLHYHLIAGLPLQDFPGLPPEFQRDYNKLRGCEILKDVWLRSLSSLGKIEWWIAGQYRNFEKLPPVPVGCVRQELKEDGQSVFLDLTTEKPSSMWGVSRFNGANCPSDLSKWWGAEKYAADVQSLADTYGAWKRYLNDHTSKTKQEQIGENIGRHWGVIGKDLFEVVDPSLTAHLTAREYAAILRLYQRMITPYMRCEGALFGKRKGYTPRRGRSGRSVSFSNPETIRRLLEWVKSA